MELKELAAKVNCAIIRYDRKNIFLSTRDYNISIGPSGRWEFRNNGYWMIHPLAALLIGRKAMSSRPLNDLVGRLRCNAKAITAFNSGLKNSGRPAEYQDFYDLGSGIRKEWRR
jgi:hypothetical protein